jgi:hypothetical protein
MNKEVSAHRIVVKQLAAKCQSTFFKFQGAGKNELPPPIKFSHVNDNDVQVLGEATEIRLSKITSPVYLSKTRIIDSIIDFIVINEKNKQLSKDDPEVMQYADTLATFIWSNRPVKTRFELTRHMPRKTKTRTRKRHYEDISPSSTSSSTTSSSSATTVDFDVRT